jgi:PhnB protein
MKITPYLNFQGRCAEAFAFYAETLGGEVTYLQTFGDSPMKDQVPADWHGAILHATLAIGGGEVIAGSDAPGEMYRTPQGFSVTLGVTGQDEARRVYAALAQGGTVTMELQSTFWTPLFGMVTDRFGIPWMINCEDQA